MIIDLNICFSSLSVLFGRLFGKLEYQNDSDSIITVHNNEGNLACILNRSDFVSECNTLARPEHLQSNKPSAIPQLLGGNHQTKLSALYKQRIDKLHNHIANYRPYEKLYDTISSGSGRLASHPYL